ncbi:MAG: DUF2812 domain-containing protein [Firmicutes bacterium]|nr:DUF2812 domain-containing protein [Bacillota bacterium]
MREKIGTWRLPPCPPYDVEGTESWLGDMASDGWMLRRDGFFLGVASFEKGEPAAVRYRLESAPRQASTWDDNGGNPDDEAVELNAEYGWEYVARRGQFYIYRNDCAGDREMNTDPQVQALAIKTLQKRQIDHFCMLLFWLVVYPLLHFWKGASLVLTAAEAGLAVVILPVLIALWMVTDGIIEIIHLQKLKKKLQSGSPLDHQKNWKNGATAYYGKKLLKVFLVVLWIVLMLRTWNRDIMDADKQKHSSYRGELPFATMEDFAEGIYHETWDDLRFNNVSEWQNAVVDQGIEWVEHAEVKRSDGSALDGGLYLTYYDAKTEWLAGVIMSELHRVDRVKAGKNYEILDCPDYGLDSVMSYRNELHFPCVVFRRGQVVIHAFFYQTGQSEPIPLEEWAGRIADSIK